MSTHEEPVLETSRLILRLPTGEDFDAYADFMADPDSAEFLGGVQPRSTAWRGFAQIVGAWQIRGFSMFSVIEKVSGEWIGRVGPWMPDGWPGTEIAWGTVRSRCNRGYATEAARASMDWAFETLGWEDVIHTIAPDNAASRAVARKLGSCNRGPGRLPPPFENAPIEIWGQTREDWQARQKTRVGPESL
ncbi:MAG: GNAT family N-acetyltransferase [Gammaproteobacteria bacterium]|nr:GNAT family N-acetyltransferase [Gammaproteobacteria bacterium]